MPHKLIENVSDTARWVAFYRAHRPASIRWWMGARSLYEFAPEEEPDFFRPYGWDVAEFRPVFDEARRLKREMPLAWLLAWIGRKGFGKGAGVALLERK